ARRGSRYADRCHRGAALLLCVPLPDLQQVAELVFFLVVVLASVGDRLHRGGPQVEGVSRPVVVGDALAPQETCLSCHCNNRIRSMRFSSLPFFAGSNFVRRLSLSPQ